MTPIEPNLEEAPIPASPPTAPTNDQIANLKLILDQREANERLVLAAIRAEELRDDAEVARVLAENAARALAESERELRVAAEFREHLIGIVGHDLRNPLGAIVLSADILIHHGSLVGEGVKLAQLITRSGQRMLRMIEHLFDFTRVRAGEGLPMERRQMDLAEVGRHVVEELTTNPAVSMRFDAHGDLTGSWDADRLAQALSNVAGNAVQHGAGGSTIVIDARADGTEVVVEVRNQGEPIAPELLPHLFEPFRRGKSEERSKQGHLGLGLYIAHHIVVAHGGTITASCAGGVTTFTLCLPRTPC